MDIHQNVNLLRYNTFAVPSTAEFFCMAASIDEVLEAREFARQQNLDVTILGGGSNVVLGSNLPGLCVHLGIKGIEMDGEVVTASAGENWHDLVLTTIAEGLSGLENLSLIPGQLGAAPIQNIGAYGVELSEFVRKVRGVELASGAMFELDRGECQFGYRNSVFKQSEFEQFLITEVACELDEKFSPRIEYAGIKETLGEKEITAASVSQAVIALRQAKLPDPKITGNAGSFFKNPMVSVERYQLIKNRLPDLPGYIEGDTVKLSAAYLIDQCGLKGRTVGGARVSERHALVIENGGSATGEEILMLAGEVQQAVASRFDINLDIEPRLLAAKLA